MNVTDENGFSPLHSAAYERNPDLVELLLRAGANVNARNEHGQTPLLVCTMTDQSDKRDAYITVVDMLIEAGADCNAQDDGGYTPLHEPALVGDIEVCRLLIAHGANARLCNKHGQSALDLLKLQNAMRRRHGFPELVLTVDESK